MYGEDYGEYCGLQPQGLAQLLARQLSRQAPRGHRAYCNTAALAVPRRLVKRKATHQSRSMPVKARCSRPNSQNSSGVNNSDQATVGRV